MWTSLYNNHSSKNHSRNNYHSLFLLPSYFFLFRLLLVGLFWFISIWNHLILMWKDSPNLFLDRLRNFEILLLFCWKKKYIFLSWTITKFNIIFKTDTSIKIPWFIMKPTKRSEIRLLSRNSWKRPIRCVFNTR